MAQEKIFISYKRKDKELVHPLVKRIEESTGIKCWIDLDGIESSAQFASKICAAINSAEVVLFMYSKTHRNIDLEEDYTVKELNYAANHKKKVILVNLDKTALYDIFDFNFSSKNNIDATDDDQVKKLIKDLKKMFPSETEQNQEPATKSNTQPATHNIKIKPNMDCKVYVDGDEVGEAKANGLFKYPVEKGEYCVTCKSIQTGESKDLEDITITDGDIMRKVEFQLASAPKTEQQPPVPAKPEVQPVSQTPAGLKTYLNICTLGHVDHGKTTLTAAISKVLHKRVYSQLPLVQFEQIDNAPEQNEGGIILSAASIAYETANRHYTHVDCPGHADYIKGLTTGGVHPDGAIMVVDAVEGPMPQTREHILLARQVNIPRLVVYINKCDIVKEEDLLELVEMDMQDLLAQYDYEDDTPIIRGSALGALQDIKKWEDTVMELMDACDTWFQAPLRDFQKPFLMPIDEVYSITGRGTVATGRITTGIVRTDDEVQLLGLGETRESVVRGVEMFRKILPEGQAGDDVGIILSDLKKKDVKPGMVMVHRGKATLHKKFKASIYVARKEEGGRHTPFQNGYRPQFHFYSMDCTGEITLPDGIEMAMPGDTVEIEGKLIMPVPLSLGLRFTIREAGKLVGAGQITEILD